MESVLFLIAVIAGALIARASGMVVRNANSRLTYRSSHHQAEEQRRSDRESISDTRRSIEDGMEYLRRGHREEKKGTVFEANMALANISTARNNILAQEKKIKQDIKEYVDAGVLTKNRAGLLEPIDLTSLSREQSSSLQKWVSDYNKIMKDIQKKKKFLDYTEARMRGFRKMTKNELRKEKPNSHTKNLTTVEGALRRTEERLNQKWLIKTLRRASRRGNSEWKSNETEKLRELLEVPRLEQPAQSAKPAKPVRPALRIPRRKTR